MDESPRQLRGAHDVETVHDLAKVRVAGSNPVVRSKKVGVKSGDARVGSAWSTRRSTE